MHQSVTSIAIVLLAAFATPAAASWMFGAPKPLNSNAATDGEAREYFGKYYGGIAGDGTGNWLAIWYSSVSNGTTSAHSSDDGIAWSQNSVVPGHPSVLAMNAQGTAIAGGGGLEWGNQVSVTRSVDYGATWSPPVYTADASDPGRYGYLFSIAAGPSGQWVFLWQYVSDADSKAKIAASRSLDDGVTWSPPVIVDDTDVPDDYRVNLAVATDQQGRWIAVWQNYVWPIGTHNEVSISTDAGATWSAPMAIGDVGDDADLATDGNGKWIVAAVQGNPNEQSDIYASMSDDDGLTWSSPASVTGYSFVFNQFSSRDQPKVRYQNGVWQIIWSQAYDTLGGSIGWEGDLVGAHSLNGGATWTDPAAINANASRDGALNPYSNDVDGDQDLACDAAGTCVLAWKTDNVPAELKTGDKDIAFARSHDDCPTAPMPACHVATEPGSSKIEIKNPYGGKDRLQWTMKPVEATLAEELGNPTISTSYALCLFDDVGGTMRNVFENDASAASACRMGACWTSMGTGYRYKDAEGINGPLRKVALLTSASGRAEIRVRAAGATLAPPVMPLAMSPTVIVQLINTENGHCWESSFSDASTNTAVLFKARGD